MCIYHISDQNVVSSGNDPATDLRGAGLLGLVNLLFFLKDPKRQTIAHDIYKLSLHPSQVIIAPPTSGNSPATDLRGAGLLGLVNLLFFLKDPKRQAIAHNIYKLSLHPSQVIIAPPTRGNDPATDLRGAGLLGLVNQGPKETGNSS